MATNTVPLSITPDTQSIPVTLAPALTTIPVSLAPVLKGEQGEQGEQGLSVSTARRHSYSSPTDYCATAPSGTADSSPTWAITRIAVGDDGTTTIGTATGAWTDRASLTYV